MMVKEWRRDALIYAELGMGFYIVSFVMSLVGCISYPLFFKRNVGFVIIIIIIGVLYSLPSLLLAWLTYNKMVKVLKKNRDPQPKWAKALEWLGYFLGIFIAGLMLYIANKKLESKNPSQCL
jgi:hypothetical protein